MVVSLLVLVREGVLVAQQPLTPLHLMPPLLLTPTHPMLPLLQLRLLQPHLKQPPLQLTLLLPELIAALPLCDSS